MVRYKYLAERARSSECLDCLLKTMLMFGVIQTTVLLVSPLIQTALGQSEDEISSLARAVPGIPGEDFPIFGEVPSTSFLCDDRVPGYYADPEVKTENLSNLLKLLSLPGGLSTLSHLC